MTSIPAKWTQRRVGERRRSPSGSPKIMKTINLDKGAYAVVSRGKNVGIEGKVLEIEKRLGTHASTVTLQDPDGNRFQTALDFVFIVGKSKSEVNLETTGGSSE